MKIGILLLLVGLALIVYLSNIKFKKSILKNIGIVFGVLLFFYGVLQIVQPDDSSYVKFTTSTISKD